MEGSAHRDDPLPPGWSRGYSNSQKREFFFHTETKHTQWHFPTASEAKNPMVAKQRADEAVAREGTLKRETMASDSLTTVDRKRQRALPPERSQNARARDDTKNNQNSSDDDALPLADSTSVAIIVPFRDLHAEQKRAAHLKQFSKCILLCSG
jgi:hypothetical protein